MKAITSSMIICFCIAVLFNVTQAQSNEPDAIKALIEKAYVSGIQNGGSIDDIRSGFHADFRMLRLIENKIIPVPIEEWISTIEKQRKENPGPPRNLTTAKFLNIDVVGNAATVKLELHREGKLIFTDYLSLYKFDEGWKIVGKTYYRH